MRSTLAAFAALTSLLVAVLLAGLTVRSFFWGEGVYARLDRWNLTVAVFSVRGQVDIWWSFNGYIPPTPIYYQANPATKTAYVSHSETTGILGFGIGRPKQYTYRWVSLPHAFLALLATIPVVVYTRRRKLAARLSANQCIQCGYDLRATPERCPECGTAAPAKVAPVV